MREVVVDRFVRAPPAEVRQALDPASVVAYEGSFEVLDVERDGDETVVTAGSHGVGMVLRFTERDDGWHYAQEGDAGPFDAMETRLSVAPENEGSRVAFRSAVSLGLPLSAVTDRVAAWKRRGELDRALRALAEDLA